ncbi:hypothetical protein FQA39_LY17286 [Lamprigera yunnana]|nr:hypothetical protein FQA39_LY17286 [Lamprigera yunnana]
MPPYSPKTCFPPEQTSFLQKLFRDILTTMREKEAYYKQLLDSHVALQQEFAEFKSAVAEDEEREVTALSVPLKPQKAPSERKTSKVKAPSEQKSQQKPPRAVLKIVDVPKPQVDAMELIKKIWMLYAEQHWTKAIDLKSVVERLYEQISALEFDANHEAIYGLERYYTV